MPYLVQEYLTGEDLDRKIKRKDAISDPEKVLYLVQIARGLEYAHSKGVIHRDIKPANIRILEDGTAKIMDFGIAKLAQRQTGLTQTGMTLGTAAYLAPEQIRGENGRPAHRHLLVRRARLRAAHQRAAVRRARRSPTCSTRFSMPSRARSRPRGPTARRSWRAWSTAAWRRTSPSATLAAPS